MNTRTTTRIATTLAAAAVVASGPLTALVATPTAAAQTTAAASAHVGQGWSAVILGNANGTGTGTLYMVSPTGQQFRVVGGLDRGSWIVDVSDDGRHVILVGSGGVQRIVDVRTGTVSPLAVQRGVARFTKPAGTNLLSRTDAGALVRTDLAGRNPVVMAGTTGGDNALPSLDGTVVVSTATDHRTLVNDNASGRVIRRIANPKGYTWCAPQHFSDATHFTVACVATNGNSEQVFRYSTTGTTPVALTARVQAKGWSQWGFSDSWSTPSGQVVSVAPPCGAAHLALVKGTIPVAFRTLSDGSIPMGVVGNSSWYTDVQQCADGEATLSRHDIATNRNVVLAGGHRNPGLVVRSAQLVDAKQ